MNNDAKLNELTLFFKEWNSKLNLSAIRETADIKNKHIKDSLQILQTEIPINNKKILDVGSGGGFPGLPIAIKSPSTQITLLDSIQKKCTYLESAISSIKIKNAKVVCSRVEDIEKSTKYDIITARAFAYLPIILESTFELLKPGGHFILYKNAETIEEELSDAASFITKYQLQKLKDFDYTINNSARKIIIIQKTIDFPDYKARSFKKLKKLYKRINK